MYMYMYIENQNLKLEGYVDYWKRKETRKQETEAGRIDRSLFIDPETLPRNQIRPTLSSPASPQRKGSDPVKKIYDWFFLGGAERDFEGPTIQIRDVSRLQEGERESFCAIDSGKSCFTFFFDI